MTGLLSATDVRALLQLLGELRELGAQPEAWRGHLVRSMESLFEARISVATELRVAANPSASTTCSRAVTAIQAVDHGLDASVRDGFYSQVFFTDHAADDTLAGLVPLYGKSFTILRGNIVTDARWERSAWANERYRAFGCDDFVMSMMPVPGTNVISSVELFRPEGRRFGERERLLLQLLHEELARDFAARQATPGVRLTPRQRQVLDRLVEGASEKDIAAELGVSPHTAHDHVKALHRAFRARSRGELLARVTRRGAPRVRLAAEAGG